MIPWLLIPLRDVIAGLSVFRYITFRTGGAVVTATLKALTAQNVTAAAAIRAYLG